MAIDLLHLKFTKNNTIRDVCKLLPLNLRVEARKRIRNTSTNTKLNEKQLHKNYDFLDKIVREALLCPSNRDNGKVSPQSDNKASNKVSLDPNLTTKLNKLLLKKTSQKTRPKIEFVCVDKQENSQITKSLDKAYKTITNVISDVCEFVPDIWIPKYVKIHFQPGKDDRAGHNSDNIHLPERYDIDGLIKHPKKNKSIAAHEFGHDVVDEIMCAAFPEYKFHIELLRHFKELYIESDKLYLKYKQYKQKIKELKKNDVSEKDIKALEKRKTDIFSQFKEKSNETTRIIVEDLNLDLRDAFLPYNEMLGDLVSILRTQNKEGELNPRVIYDSLYSPRLESTLSEKKFRYLKRVNGWRDWSQKCSLNTWNVKNAHIKLNPTRYHIWKHYLSEPQFRHNRQHCFVNIVKAVVQAFDEQWNNGQFIEMSPKEMNIKLIKRIDKIMCGS